MKKLIAVVVVIVLLVSIPFVIELIRREKGTLPQLYSDVLGSEALSRVSVYGVEIDSEKRDLDESLARALSDYLLSLELKTAFPQRGKPSALEQMRIVLATEEGTSIWVYIVDEGNLIVRIAGGGERVAYQTVEVMDLEYLLSFLE